MGSRGAAGGMTAATNAALPDAALYVGGVMHLRRSPFRHRFAYRIFMTLTDVDAPPRLRLARVAAEDHGPRTGSPLRPWVSAQLAAHGLEDAAHRILLLSIPRVLGYAFNPIAFFFCHDRTGRLAAVLHQVKNTFGHQHGYLLPVPGPGTVHGHAAKLLHVSPFMPVAGRYGFSLTPPQARFACTIRHGDFTAAMRLERRELTDAALARALLAMPLMPAKVFAAIHWQALLLWLKGARYHPVPPPPAEPVSLGTTDMSQRPA
jgi:hypothetical protein